MRLLLVALLFLTTACRRAPAPELRADPAPAASSGPTAAERTACAVIERTHAAALARLKGDAQVAPLLDKLPALLGRCLPSTRGAYGFVLDQLCVEPTKFDDGHPDADVIGRWHFVHADGAGHLARYRIANGGIGACDGHIDHQDTMTIVGTKAAPHEWLKAPQPLLFDYDGDGEKEVLVDLESRVVQDSPETGDLSRYTYEHVHLLTFRDGVLDDVKATKGLYFQGTSRDLDGDGRPDLRVYRILGDTSRPWTEIPLEFFAHSLPGGAFALDDDVALRAALSSCGKRGALIAREPKGALDANATIANVVCARLAGTTPQSIGEKLAAECAGEAACDKLAKECVKAVERLPTIGK